MFKPGDKVKCIDDSGRTLRVPPVPPLILDHIYEVDRVNDMDVYLKDIDFGYSFKRFVLAEAETKVCPDCKGSGVYVGFNSIEPCALCKGIKNVN